MEKNYYEFSPIGYVQHLHSDVPRHWSISDLEAEIIIYDEYKQGLRDIKKGDIIIVLFCFHKSPEFTPERLIVKPPHLNEKRGLFSTCSPVRPNPIGLSVVEVTEVNDGVLKIKHVDMINGTPVLDIKPYIPYKTNNE